MAGSGELANSFRIYGDIIGSFVELMGILFLLVGFKVTITKKWWIVKCQG